MLSASRSKPPQNPVPWRGEVCFSQTLNSEFHFALSSLGTISFMRKKVYLGNVIKETPRTERGNQLGLGRKLFGLSCGKALTGGRRGEVGNRGPRDQLGNSGASPLAHRTRSSWSGLLAPWLGTHSDQLPLASPTRSAHSPAGTPGPPPGTVDTTSEPGSRQSPLLHPDVVHRAPFCLSSLASLRLLQPLPRACPHPPHLHTGLSLCRNTQAPFLAVCSGQRLPSLQRTLFHRLARWGRDWGRGTSL